MVSPPSVDWLLTLDKTSATLHIYRKKILHIAARVIPNQGIWKR